MDILKIARERLSKDFASLSDEWEALFSLPRSNTERLELLKWVFSESPAYWNTRVRAGRILLQENEEETWLTIKHLVDSHDPDDNGTALTLFEELDDPRCFELAHRWLRDGVYPATQLDAVEYLREIYPEEVHRRLQELIHHENRFVRKRAQELLGGSGSD